MNFFAKIKEIHGFEKFEIEGKSSKNLAKELFEKLKTDFLLLKSPKLKHVQIIRDDRSILKGSRSFEESKSSTTPQRSHPLTKQSTFILKKDV